MERMEQRQDNMEAKVSDLATVVNRVELNQQHATELATLRFNAVDTAVKNIDGTLERFMGRINAIVSGEVQLPQNQAIMNAYLEWQRGVEARFGELDPGLKDRVAELEAKAIDPLNARVRILEDRSVREQGVFATFGATRTFILAFMAVLGPIVAIISILTR
jgi:hypothetical protein